MGSAVGDLSSELDRLVKEVEGKFNEIWLLLVTAEDQVKWFNSCPASTQVVISQLLPQTRRTRMDLTHTPGGNSSNEDHTRIEDVGCSSESASDSDISDPNDQDHLCSGSPKSNNDSPELDARKALYRPLKMSDSLHHTLMKHDGDPQKFLGTVNQGGQAQGGQATGGLKGAFIRLQQGRQDIIDDTDRELYMQVHFLHRRFEYRNFYRMAVALGYHTGKRWRRNACQELEEAFQKEHPNLEVTRFLHEYVSFGSAFNDWVEELGGPGCLLLLPLTVTEIQYTERRYKPQFSFAVDALRRNNIEGIMKEKGLDLLGQKITQELWTKSQDDSLKRHVGSSGSGRKRQRDNTRVEEIHKTPRVSVSGKHIGLEATKDQMRQEGSASTRANEDQPLRWTEETRAGDPSLNADFSAFFGDTNADFSAFFGDTNADFPLDFLLPDMPVWNPQH